MSLVILVILLTVGIIMYEERVLAPSMEPAAVLAEMPFLEVDHNLVTVKTTRIGSDDPILTAVAVSQIVYPVTESEDSPGAVVLVNRQELAETADTWSSTRHGNHQNDAVTANLDNLDPAIPSIF